MNLSNDKDDTSSNTTNGTRINHVDSTNNNSNPSSSPPSTPPSGEAADTTQLDDNPPTSSSPDRRSDIDEQPIIISPEYLQTITQLVESLAPRRVKVYELRGEVWVDLGTGFCQGYVEDV